MGLKVIGTGLSRTGTTTIRSVIEELGLGPCYNSGEFFTHPRGIEFWEALEQGKKVDFDEFFKNYNAIIGFPGYIFAQELLAKYPDAKVILSLRDPEEWYEDIANTVFVTGPTHVNKNFSKAVSEFDPYLSGCIDRIHAMQKRIIEDGYFEGRFADKDYAVKRFNQWNEDVKKSYSHDRLLVYRVTEGWKPICEFLGVPVPEGKAYPHLNHRDNFNQNSTSGFLERLKKAEAELKP